MLHFELISHIRRFTYIHIVYTHRAYKKVYLDVISVDVIVPRFNKDIGSKRF